MKAIKLLTLTLLLVGCQTGLKEGTLVSSFPPEGWETTVTDSRTQYLCNPPACASTELILVDDLPIAGLSEKLIRDGKVGPDVVAKVDAYVTKARKGAYKAEAALPVSTDSYAGFRHKATLTEDGKIIFMAGQSIVQGSRGVIVLSLAHDNETAERNLNSYLIATKVERPQ
ncbi:hypothetical protein [Roseibium alexandrii]|uniref:Uncharacterized protein n=1 Tax=Roseibium alexandrii TaxID=388408 RepID=A0A0M7ANM9_9HYPH|nr:hypothetical protein [Roseibium alexandrii]CTQ76725.1 hypothetical protein LAX5112_04688 [Roseibium alexandrii]